MDTFHPAHPQRPSTFGPSFDLQQDGKRLSTQLQVLTDFMLFCRGINAWVSLAEIEEQTGIPQSSASSQLRHLRKKAFGEHKVEKRRRSAGTWEYFLIPNGEEQ